MRKIIMSAVMAIALLTSTAVIAQDKKDCPKTKSECCKKDADKKECSKKDKKECPTDKKECEKECSKKK